METPPVWHIAIYYGTAVKLEDDCLEITLLIFFLSISQWAITMPVRGFSPNFPYQLLSTFSTFISGPNQLLVLLVLF